MTRKNKSLKVFLKRAVITAFLFLASGNSLIASDAKNFFDDIALKSRGINDISFNFSQDIYMAGSTRTVTAEVFFKKPRTLKALYTEPYAQEIYFDNDTLYTFIPGIGQATKQNRRDFEELFGVTVSLLTSDDPYSRLHGRFGMDIEKEEGKTILRMEDLVDKDKIITVTFGKLMLPEKTVMEGDNFRAVTEFENYRKNSSYSPDFFKFDVKRAENYIEID